MTERAYVTVDRADSPRLVEVASVGGGGADEISIQDLHDTLNSNTLPAGDADDSLDNMDDEALVASEGKATLGVGLETGITLSLQNAQLAFEGNYVPAQTGTATAIGTTTLTDAGATFIANGVERGAVILNWDDQGATEVLEVLSETQLRHRPFSTGIGMDWQIGDNYSIFNVIRKRVTDGNLVAVDADGITPIDSIFPTFCTQVTVELDTSAAQVATSGLTPSQQEIRDALTLPRSLAPQVDSVDELLDSTPADVVAALGAASYDGVPYTDVIAMLLAMATGRIRETVIGSDKQYEIFAQDNTTVLYTFTKTTVLGNKERVRS